MRKLLFLLMLFGIMGVVSVQDVVAQDAPQTKKAQKDMSKRVDMSQMVPVESNGRTFYVPKDRDINKKVYVEKSEQTTEQKATETQGTVPVVIEGETYAIPEAIALPKSIDNKKETVGTSIKNTAVSKPYQQTPVTIESLEKRIEMMEQKLADPDFVKDERNVKRAKTAIETCEKQIQLLKNNK